MLTFVIPLRSKKVSNSWTTVSKLLERTLRSVCNQTSSDFRVIVVCHERPDIEYTHPKIEYIEVDFPPAKPDNKESKYIDQSRKMWTGLQYASEFADSHVMFVDSDDCISNKVAEFVSKNSGNYGWFFWSGYEYRDGERTIRCRRERFNSICGTSNIIRTNILMNHIRGSQLSDIKDRTFLQHTRLATIMKNAGTPLQRFPFPGAIYITDNSENFESQATLILKSIKGNYKLTAKYLAMRLFKVVTSRPVNQSICDEFGLYQL